MTRFKMQRAFYVPEDSIIVEKPGLTFYLYNSLKNGAPCCACFIGRAKKPAWRYRYKNEAGRQQAMDRQAEATAKRKAEQDARRKERFKPHTVKVGDLFATSWGYDQTNVEFYECTAVNSKNTITARRVCGEHKADGPMSGQCRAKPGAFVEDKEPFRARASMQGGSPSFKGDYDQIARPTTLDKWHYESSYC